MVIRAIVYAKDEKEAFLKAKDTFERLTENSTPFDYYVTFDDKEAKMSGRARWGNLPIVASADSPEGKQLIDEGMQSTKDAFLRSLDIVKKTLAEKSCTEIFETNDTIDPRLNDMFRFYCHELGQYKGGCLWLYTQDAEGIQTPTMLQNVLSKWKELYEGMNQPNPYEDLKVWVVPADVHH